jgi:hypothetical protein
MYSTVLSSVPRKGPSELEESEEEGASSLCKDWGLEPSQNMMIGVKGRSLPQAAADRRRGVGRTLIVALGARHCYRKT